MREFYFRAGLTKEEKEKLNILKRDIENLKSKLLHCAVTPPKQKDEEIGQMAENRRKQEVREIRSILKDKITTYEAFIRASFILGFDEVTE